MAGGLTFAAVGVGEASACGLTTGGAAYCWGHTWLGQLGNGDTTTESSVPVPVVGGLTFKGLSVGWQSACGVTPSGVAYCWGNNYSGELGAGTSAFYRSTPVKVAGQP